MRAFTAERQDEVISEQTEPVDINQTSMQYARGDSKSREQKYRRAFESGC